MIFGSICSGIEAASVAWNPLGWRAAFFSEIEPFARAVLAHRHPGIPLHGDFTTIQANQYEPIAVLIGGTPCQSFSVAGLRAGLDDARGNLALEYSRLVHRLRPRWILWENVPGVLSSGSGRDFGSIIGAMVELGYGVSWRVLDAKYFGLAQRRKRVFLVGYLGDWRRAAEVLFEREGLRWDSPPRREAREAVAPTLVARTKGGGGLGRGFDQDGGLIAHTLRGDGFDASEDGTGRGTPLVPCAYRTNAAGQVDAQVDIAASLTRFTDPTAQFIHAHGVRRITPREAERLQGFPDDYTLVPYRGQPAKDSPRYKALGNSMATPVIRWIGERIEAVDNYYHGVAT